MGNIIKNLSDRVPSIYIERRIDNIETQKLRFDLVREKLLNKIKKSLTYLKK